MKFTELLINQKIIVQMLWGEQKIEFPSEVIEVDGDEVFVTPYLHNGSALEINVTQGKGVICNIFTDDPITGQRISWKNVELSTVNRNDDIVYSIKTNGFNIASSNADRRLRDRVVVGVEATLYEGQSTEGVSIVVHDLSDNGISFYTVEQYVPKSNKITITFMDKIDDKVFNVRVDCSIARVTKRENGIFVGCKILGENKDYLLYGFLKRLKAKKYKVNLNEESQALNEDSQALEEEQ